jgi:uncharacterized Zn finger protein (UPF0148 family)
MPESLDQIAAKLALGNACIYDGDCSYDPPELCRRCQVFAEEIADALRAAQATGRTETEARIKAEAQLNRPQPISEQPSDRFGPIVLNEAQERAVKQWAADDRLWTTQETVEFNLRTVARIVLVEAQSRITALEAERDLDTARIEKLAESYQDVCGELATVERGSAEGRANRPNQCCCETIRRHKHPPFGAVKRDVSCPIHGDGEMIEPAKEPATGSAETEARIKELIERCSRQEAKLMKLEGETVARWERITALEAKAKMADGLAKLLRESEQRAGKAEAQLRAAVAQGSAEGRAASRTCLQCGAEVVWPLPSAPAAEPKP